MEEEEVFLLEMNKIIMLLYMFNMAEQVGELQSMVVIIIKVSKLIIEKELQVYK